MEIKTDWKQFLQYQPTTNPNQPRRRVKSWPMYIVEVAPGQKEMMYHDEYEAMIAAEKAAKDAQRAARETELASSRPEASESRASVEGRRACPPGRGDSLPPDLERHSRRCLICSHPDRDAIEGEFIRWRSPQKIIRDYNLADRNSIYRHAHATNLFQARRRQIGRVLESYLETIDDTPPADFDPVTRAVRVYAHLDPSGAWVEPDRTLRILTSRTPWPSPDSDPEPDDDPHGSRVEPDDDDPHPAPAPAHASERGGRAFRSDIKAVGASRPLVEQSPRSVRNDSCSRRPPLTAATGHEPISAVSRYSEAPAGTPPESGPVRECGESVPETKPAASAATCGSRATEPLVASQESRFAGGRISTKVAAFGRDIKSKGEEKALGAVAANRDNPKIKNRHNQQQTNDIPKVNRDKNATSASPGFRPSLKNALTPAASKIPQSTRSETETIQGHREGK